MDLADIDPLSISYKDRGTVFYLRTLILGLGRQYLCLFGFSALFPWSTPRRCAGKRSAEVTEIECESWNKSKTTTKLVGHYPFQRVCRR